MKKEIKVFISNPNTFTVVSRHYNITLKDALVIARRANKYGFTADIEINIRCDKRNNGLYSSDKTIFFENGKINASMLNSFAYDYNYNLIAKVHKITFK